MRSHDYQYLCGNCTQKYPIECLVQMNPYLVWFHILLLKVWCTESWTSFDNDSAVTSSNFLIHWLLPPRDSHGLDKKRMTSTAYNEILSSMSNIFMPSTLLLYWILWLICSRVMVKREGKKGHHCLLLLDKVKTSERYPLFLYCKLQYNVFKKVLDHCVRLPKLSSNSFLSAYQKVLQHIMLIDKYVLYFYFAKVCNL